MKNLIIYLLLISPFLAKSQTLTIQEINQKLGKGINMGNMFEAPTETEWGNPYKDDYFERIAKLGFNSVRIPIRWETDNRALLTEPFTINPTFFTRIKSVVDKAMSNNLYVIINMHHHDEIFANPDKAKPRFLSQWSQIAEFFKNYDQRLVFEFMNEPHDNLTPEIWNNFFKDALQTIRRTNPTRAVLMGMAEYGGLSGVSKLQIPDDKNLILTVHYYNPFSFTHQGAEWIGADAQKWLGTQWEDLTTERNQIINEFDFLRTLAKQKNIPVHVGEFGAYSKADLASRVRWTTFLARWFEQQNFSWAYWEFSAGFGIYDPAKNEYNTNLVDALIKNPMPLPKTLPTKELYKSDFSNGNDGWNLNVQPTSSANFSRNNGSLNIDVKSASTNSWHVQLTKNNISLVNKKRYLVTFKAITNKNVSFTSYLGKASDPYNSYSGYPNFDISTTEKEFSYTFQMNDPSDQVARMSFDLGGNIANITISSIKIEELLDNSATVTALELVENTLIYPNPAEDFVSIKIQNSIEKIEVFDQSGKIFFAKILQGETSVNIDVRTFPAGIYFVTIFSKNQKLWGKIIKL